jgi:hypothetical protein
MPAATAEAGHLHLSSLQIHYVADGTSKHGLSGRLLGNYKNFSKPDQMLTIPYEQKIALSHVPAVGDVTVVQVSFAQIIRIALVTAVLAIGT